jgi:hypothetical protein
MAEVANKMIVQAGNIRPEILPAIITYHGLLIIHVIEISFADEATGGDVHFLDLKI